ncbi:MAG: hypothetical protein KDE27_27335, partial [Planctomycetes bacterium]|nr:hypothetical protein [Planctomycetota bacterium]
RSVASGDLVAALAGHQGTVVDVAFDGSGDVLVTAAWDNSVRFWDLRTRAPLIAPIFGNRFLAVAGSTLLTEAGDQVNARHLERASELLRSTADDIFGGSATVTATADGRLLATAGHNGVRLWDGASVRPLAVAAAEPARGAVLAADGEMVVAGVGDRVLRWSVPRAVGSAGLGAAEVVYSGERIRSVTRGPTDDSVLVADRRGLVLVDRRTGARLAALPRHDGMETGASVSPDGRFAFTGTWRGAPARVRALGSGSELARWEGAHVIGVFGPANRWLCVASTDEFLLVEVGTWRSVRRIPRAQPDTIAGAIAFATDGHTVALGITRYATALVSTADGRVLARFENPDHIAATDLAFGDGDGRLVLVSPSRALMAWDLGEVRNRLRSLDLDWNERIGARR